MPLYDRTNTTLWMGTSPIDLSQVTFDSPTLSASNEAVRSLLDVLLKASSARDPLPRLAFSVRQQFAGDLQTLSAGLAIEGRLRSYPSEALLNACAAVLAWKEHGFVVDVRHSHGFPILSLRGDTATIAGEGASEQRPLSGDDWVEQALCPERFDSDADPIAAEAA